MYRVWNETRFNRSTQLVFCDLSTPKKAYRDYDPAKDFDVYNDVKTKLVNMGIPEKEIAFIHEAENDVAKQVLFDSVRSGKVRILIGSTEKCGAGTNVQNKLIAIHHLDTPYRPSDMEQREGRGIRQGNENEEISIYTYVTERTFDSYSYQILENKQRFISQINRGDLSVREAADIDETTLTYSEIKAITSANPLIKRKFEVENKLNDLRILQGQYKANRYSLQDNVNINLPKLIVSAELRLANLEKDFALKENTATEAFVMTVNGKVYTERKEAAEELYKYITNLNAGKKIASIQGFDIIPEHSENINSKFILIKGHGTYRQEISLSELGTLTRIENFFKNMENSLMSAKVELAKRKSELASGEAELKKPFEHEVEILSLASELAEIDSKLNLDKAEIAPVIDDEEFQDEVVEIDESDNESECDDDGFNFVEVDDRAIVSELMEG